MKLSELKLNESYQILDVDKNEWTSNCEFMGYNVKTETYIFRVITKDSKEFENEMKLNGICYDFIYLSPTDIYQLVRENDHKGIGKDDLLLGEMYSLYDYGVAEWVSEYEYLGYDSNSGDYMFKNYDGNGFFFVGIDEKDLETDVKLNS